MSLLNFNASEVAPSTGFDPIPAGKYVAVISDSEMRSTNSGTGQYLSLEFTIIGLNVSAENLQAAESRIRDTDMAREMVEFTKNQILQQSGTAMLAQANQNTQNVLSLLQ